MVLKTFNDRSLRLGFEVLVVEKHSFRERWTRSLVKALSYRVLIIILDFTVVYLLSGKVETAFWLMLISNFYTSAAYFVHERVWDAVSWGKNALQKSSGKETSQPKAN